MSSNNVNTVEEIAAQPGKAGDPAPADYGARNGDRGGERLPISQRRRAANQANGRKSHGPVTTEGKQRSSQNARKPTDRLLGLAEVRTLHYQPGAALKLYRELITPYEPAPALLARHMQDLARLCLELEAMESIRDAMLDHRAQQNTIRVRISYREMDAELGVSPEEVFERGLHDLPDSPAKLKKQIECVEALKDSIGRREFDKIGPMLRQLYGNALNPKSEDKKLICIDCQRLMDPGKRPSVSEEEIRDLLVMLDAEERWAWSGYELELDKRTVTGSAAITRLAPRRRDQWMYLQVERLRRAIDRKQRVITGLLKTPSLAKRYGSDAAGDATGDASGEAGAGVREASGQGGPPKIAQTNPRSALESTKAIENEPKTNPNEPMMSRDLEA
jgi:hypothetical protein